MPREATAPAGRRHRQCRAYSDRSPPRRSASPAARRRAIADRGWPVRFRPFARPGWCRASGSILVCRDHRARPNLRPTRHSAEMARNRPEPRSPPPAFARVETKAARPKKRLPRETAAATSRFGIAARFRRREVDPSAGRPSRAASDGGSRGLARPRGHASRCSAAPTTRYLTNTTNPVGPKPSGDPFQSDVLCFRLSIRAAEGRAIEPCLSLRSQAQTCSDGCNAAFPPEKPRSAIILTPR